mmetsp:Transcript_27829/g.55995  ORF Transcript_27829/g.55995 Transcript_27829/m.55995 type:complete len:108 (+) Transcript_27829:722-1045(+)
MANLAPRDARTWSWGGAQGVSIACKYVDTFWLQLHLAVELHEVHMHRVDTFWLQRNFLEISDKARILAVNTSFRNMGVSHERVCRGTHATSDIGVLLCRSSTGLLSG